MKKYSLSEIANFDNELFALANYEAAEGLIPIFKDQKETHEFRCKVAKIFNRHKKSIQDGECDLDFILDTVMAKYGAIPRPKLTAEETVEKFIAGEDMNQIKYEDFTDTIMNLYKNIKKNNSSVNYDNLTKDYNDFYKDYDKKDKKCDCEDFLDEGNEDIEDSENDEDLFDL